MKHALQVVFENAGLDIRSYSGRGMYDKTCIGFTTNRNIGNAFADIISSLAHSSDSVNMEEVADAFRTMQTDSMGFGTIVYFPGTEFVDESVDEFVDEFVDE